MHHGARQRRQILWRVAGCGYVRSGYHLATRRGLAASAAQRRHDRTGGGQRRQKVLLWGKNLRGATSVSFNGTLATKFSVPSSQGVWVWVPEGATSGPITVTTPNGSFTTMQGFTVQ